MESERQKERNQMILVTGAAGHIGNVLVRQLLKGGSRVRALVLPGEDTRALDGLEVEMVTGDVLDLASLMKAMQGVEYVFHLAGIISIMPGRDDLMRRVNIQGTKNIIKAARASGVKRVLHTSSIHALSRDCRGVIDEQVPFDAHNPEGEYDRTKAEASIAVQAAARRGLDAVIVCPTGVIGPFDFRGSEMGELLRGWMQKKPHVLIEGAYDFVDVRDVARGMILAVEKGRTGEVYILSGEQIKLNRMKQLVQTVMGFTTATINIPMALARLVARMSPLYYRLTGQTPKFTTYSLDTVCSNSVISHAKASRELGYRARPLLKSVADTISWWRKNKSTEAI
jgi:dihydroflavonol-4-reductase